MVDKNKTIKESPLFWPAYFKGKQLFVLDETLIPERVHYIPVNNAREAVRVIRDMKTRAFGQLLVVLSTFLLEIRISKKCDDKELFQHLQKVAEDLNNSRPTFPFAEVTGMVLSWAQQALDTDRDLKITVTHTIQGYLSGIRERRLGRVQKIVKILREGDSVLTHCNVSGELAMAAALCREQGKSVRFFATETRPYMQGSKLTTWELKKLGADVTLIADNAVASVMAEGFITKVIVGSDRSCANGDFANKIGTYQIAVLAEEFKIPFYVLTQPSSQVKEGKDIPIEIRQSKELLKYNNVKTLLGNVDGFYPGFDVVPNRYITETIPIDVR